jgi:hypothetical protein
MLRALRATLVQGAKGGMAVERVGKDVSALSAAERAAAALRDAPELLVLLGELRGCLGEVRSRLGPLLKEVRAKVVCLGVLEVHRGRLGVVHVRWWWWCVCGGVCGWVGGGGVGVGGGRGAGYGVLAGIWSGAVALAGCTAPHSG